MLWFICLTCLVFGCITSLIASAKRRNALGWLAIGTLYPLLGVILAIVLPANPPPTDS